MSVDVLQGQTLREHQHLEVIEQLGDLLRRLGVGLELRGHPHLGGLFDDLLADRVHTRIELGDRAGTGGTLLGFDGELSEQLVERLHPARVANRAAPSGPGPPQCAWV